jgi:hypothetical protein
MSNATCGNVSSPVNITWRPSWADHAIVLCKIPIGGLCGRIVKEAHVIPILYASFLPSAYPMIETCVKGGGVIGTTLRSTSLLLCSNTSYIIIKLTYDTINIIFLVKIVGHNVIVILKVKLLPFPTIDVIFQVGN